MAALTFAKVHDATRMNDPKVLVVRKLVEAVPSEELAARGAGTAINRENRILSTAACSVHRRIY